jgi:hypothetical protein
MNISSTFFPFSFLTLLVILQFTFLVQAQTDEASKPQYDVWRGNSNVLQTRNNEVRGSQFYNEEWRPGKIIFRDKKVTQKLPLKYNSYENLVIFKEGNKMRVYPPSEIQGFIFLNEEGEVTERFINGILNEDHNIEPTQLFRVIYNGETKLLAKHKTFFSKNAGRDPFSNVKYSEFDQKVDYFIFHKDGELTETRIRRRSLIKDLGSYKDKLREYAKSANMKIRSEKEAITLLYYFDQLHNKE